MIRGLELIALGRTKSFELVYDQGTYRNVIGEEIDSLLDMSCYNCGNAYYTLEEDAIPFCPHCGNFERKKFDSYEDLCAWSREQNWGFTKYISETYVAVQTDDRWEIRPTTQPDQMKRQGRYLDVRMLLDES